MTSSESNISVYTSSWLNTTDNREPVWIQSQATPTENVHIVMRKSARSTSGAAPPFLRSPRRLPCKTERELDLDLDLPAPATSLGIDRGLAPPATVSERGGPPRRRRRVGCCFWARACAAPAPAPARTGSDSTGFDCSTCSGCAGGFSFSSAELKPTGRSTDPQPAASPAHAKSLREAYGSRQLGQRRDCASSPAANFSKAARHCPWNTCEHGSSVRSRVQSPWTCSHVLAMQIGQTWSAPAIPRARRSVYAQSTSAAANTARLAASDVSIEARKSSTSPSWPARLVVSRSVRLASRRSQ